VRLLLTRPEPDGARTAAALRGRGHTVVLARLLHIEPIANVEIGSGPWAAILVTSGNAARAIAANKRHEALLGVPVFAVGERSAEAMRAAGFAAVTAADGGVDDLARLVAGRMPPGARLLYLAGEDRSGDLGGDLRGRGFFAQTVALYRAVAAVVLPQAAADALAGGVEGVLHFSRRSADTYVASARAAGVLESALRPAHFCLSAEVAEPLQRAGAGTIRVASRPVEAALIALVGAYPR
jgi:uroporphyrinogen-III synthase